MAGLERIGTVRAFGLGLAAASLAACASTPAPVSVLNEAAPWVSAATPPVEANGEPRIASGGPPLQCVPFAREESGIEIYGDANTWWRQAAGRYPRSNSPAPGAVLVMRGYHNPRRGHVAVVTQVVSSRVILVDQANWFNHGEISRNIPVADVSPDNDWSEVRVWYVPNRQWGARIYHAHGFIHPFLLTAEIN